MKQCIKSILDAAVPGRNFTPAQIQEIFDNIMLNQRLLARRDPNAWEALPADEKLRQSAEYGANQVIHNAELKKRRVALTIVARNRFNNKVDDIMARGVAKNRVDAVDRLLAYTPDNKTGHQALDTRVTATRNLAVGRLMDTWDAADPKMFGLFENEQGIKDLVSELYGKETGNELAKKGADAWRETTEFYRKRFNDAGGDVGRLDNWSMPQEHSQVKISKAGPDAWLDDILPKLDRNMYVKEDGQLMTAGELEELFRRIYQTVSTGGINKLSGNGSQGSSMRANRRNDSRQIFFKDGDSFMQYHQKYGDHGIFDIMLGHVEGISRDISTVEMFGPNSNLMFKSVIDDALRDASLADPANTVKLERRANQTTRLYDFVAGNTKPAIPSRFAKAMDTLRNLLTGSRLGSAAITSITDQGTLNLMARTNGISLGQLYLNQMKAWNPADSTSTRMAQRNGLALETVMSSLNRWGADNMGRSWSSKAATTVLRLSGLMKLSDSAKEAYGVTMMSSVGHVVRTNKDLASLTKTSKFDAELIKRHGVTDTDFDVWKMAEREDWGNGNTDMLTAESIMDIPDSKLEPLGNPDRLRFEAARKLIGMLSEESDIAVITPGTRDRLLLQSDLQRGTLSGEIMRSITQFKAFPFAAVARLYSRGMSLHGNLPRFYYFSTLLLSTTLMGAAALQANNVVSGRKPQEMDSTTFWLQAMLKGGALGVYGDFLLSDESSSKNGLFDTLSGALGGTAYEFLRLTQGNIIKSMQGKDTTVGADTIKFVKGLTPGQNLWYTKAITDHILFNQLQELVNPGYLKRMRERSEKTYGTKYWWRPEDTLPR